MQEQQPPTAVAANLFQELIYQNKDRLTAGIIVAGWDKFHGGRVFNCLLVVVSLSSPGLLVVQARHISMDTATRHGAKVGTKSKPSSL